MMPSNAIATLTVFAVFLIFCITWRPEYLSDENYFLKEFVDQDLLAFLGIILTLSLSLLAQLFISVGKLSEKLGPTAVTDIREELRSTAKVLVGVFFGSLLVVFAKPILPSTEVWMASINALVVWLVVFYSLILADVVLSIFDFDI